MNIKTEPVAIVHIARAVIYMLAAFSFITWSDMQVEAVLIVVGLLVPVVETLSGIYLRRNVTPEQTFIDAGTTSRKVKDVAKDDRLVMRPYFK